METKKDYITKLRARGMSWVKIGVLMGFSRQRAHQIGTGYMSYKKATSIDSAKEDSIAKLELTKEPMGHMSGGLGKFRERIRIRDNRTCQICFKVWVEGERRLDVHHMDDEFEGRSGERGVIALDRKNFRRMITLCHKCHLNLHTVREKMTKRKRKLST